ncbi:hypothetical protein SGFS_054750 [Streptomyces graminofaciens]|uniref:Uncharacterized protein n=1 Tax=Streptomyces graminofaciens TaxID=68212 RepID=A0ABN5VLB8_9ACTN|nr:hypothetical protein SGFS_054750 [Streptomyces graminofaciens]
MLGQSEELPHDTVEPLDLPLTHPMPDELKEPHVMGGTVKLRPQQGPRLGPALGGGEIDDRKLRADRHEMRPEKVKEREGRGQTER